MRTLEELLLTPRMGPNTPFDEVNCVEGLVNLIQDINITNKVICEIGCYLGVSTETFLKFSPSKMYCIDFWGSDPNYKETEWTQNNFSDVESTFRSTMSEYPSVEIIKKNSVEAALDIPDNSLDLVYIDASHDMFDVLKDIKAWLPKIKQGGYIAGHDINLGGTVYGVKFAVIEEQRLQGVQTLQEPLHSHQLPWNSPDGRFKTYRDCSWSIQV